MAVLCTLFLACNLTHTSLKPRRVFPLTSMLPGIVPVIQDMHTWLLLLRLKYLYLLPRGRTFRLLSRSLQILYRYLHLKSKACIDAYDLCCFWNGFGSSAHGNKELKACFLCWIKKSDHNDVTGESFQLCCNIYQISVTTLKQRYPSPIIMYDYCHDCFISTLGNGERESNRSAES